MLSLFRRQAVELFLKHLGPRSQQRLEAISTRDVLAFRDELIEQGRAPSTVNLLVPKGWCLDDLQRAAYEKMKLRLPCHRSGLEVFMAI